MLFGRIRYFGFKVDRTFLNHYKTTVMNDADVLITEGKVNIKLPDGVFYNRVQEFNRDITLAVIKQYERLNRLELFLKFKKKIVESNDMDTTFVYNGIRILEALSATGIRSVRFAREIPNVSKIIANDMDSNAVSVIEESVRQNKVLDYVDITCSDAIGLMHIYSAFEKKLNVVDIDPFGTVSPFLDSAVQCLHNGGLLCVTSTDMAVLCGSTYGTSMGKYGGMAVNSCAPHEFALRLVLNAIQSAASRHGKVIEPLLSLSVDFYVRIFVRVWSSDGGVKKIAAKHGICFHCRSCYAYHIQPLGQFDPKTQHSSFARGPCIGPICETCGTGFILCGPIWIGELHSRPFLYDFLTGLGHKPAVEKLDDDELSLIKKLENDLNLTELGKLSFAPNLTPNLNENENNYGTLRRIIGMATMAYEELPDVPLYYLTDKLCSAVSGIVPPVLDIHSSMLNAGYRVSASHAAKGSFKTDAPISFIFDSIISYNKMKSNNLTEKKSKSSNRCFKKELTDEKPDTAPHRKNECQLHRIAVRNTILARPVNPHVDFTLHRDAKPQSKSDNYVRFQVNPEKDWGPKSRPKIRKIDDIA